MEKTKKVSFVVEVPDDAFDEAALQIIKGKVRELVSKEYHGKIEKTLEETVASKAKELYDSRGYNCFGRALEEELRKKMQELFADAKINDAGQELVNKFKREHLKQIRQILTEQLELVPQNVQGMIDNAVDKAVRKLLSGLVEK